VWSAWAAKTAASFQRDGISVWENVFLEELSVLCTDNGAIVTTSLKILSSRK
jgi:hypothetical protein